MAVAAADSRACDTYFLGSRCPFSQINLQTALNMRISYTDYKLYLSIIEAVSKQLNKAIRMDAATKGKEDLPEHDFDRKGTLACYSLSGPACREIAHQLLFLASRQ